MEWLAVSGWIGLATVGGPVSDVHGADPARPTSSQASASGSPSARRSVLANHLPATPSTLVVDGMGVTDASSPDINPPHVSAPSITAPDISAPGISAPNITAAAPRALSLDPGDSSPLPRYGLKASATGLAELGLNANPPSGGMRSGADLVPSDVESRSSGRPLRSVLVGPIDRVAVRPVMGPTDGGTILAGHESGSGLMAAGGGVLAMPAGGTTTDWRMPRLRVQTVGPTVVPQGEAVVLQIRVTNEEATPVGQADVLVNVPESVSLLGTSPAAESDGPTQVRFPLTELRPGETRTLALRMMVTDGPTDGGVTDVTTELRFPSAPRHRLVTGEAALVLDVQPPATAFVDEPIVCALRVTNPGTLPASEVRILANAPLGATDEDVSIKIVPIGTIGPGETRIVQYATVPTRSGPLPVSFQATGLRGVRAETRLDVPVVARPLSVRLIRLGDGGGSEPPMIRVNVTTDHATAAGTLTVALDVPPGLVPDVLDSPAQFDSRTSRLTWTNLVTEPGQTESLQVRFRPTGPVTAPVRATAIEARAEGVTAVTMALDLMTGAATELVAVPQARLLGGRTTMPLPPSVVSAQPAGPGEVDSSVSGSTTASVGLRLPDAVRVGEPTDVMIEMARPSDASADLDLTLEVRRSEGLRYTDGGTEHVRACRVVLPPGRTVTIPVTVTPDQSGRQSLTVELKTADGSVVQTHTGRIEVR